MSLFLDLCEYPWLDQCSPEGEKKKKFDNFPLGAALIKIESNI